MLLQSYTYLTKREPEWFTRVRRTFGSLIYDTSVQELGMDTRIKRTIDYDLNRITLDIITRCYVRWKE